VCGRGPALVGRSAGGVGQFSILSSRFFGGVSGSALADVSAVGGTMIPQMVKRGYDRDFAVNVCITAALVALLVPPSHNLILYSAAAGGSLSITDLFAAGILPALLMTSVLMVTCYLVARHRGYGVELFPGWPAVLRSLVVALPGLGLVALIFIGIKAGIFTAVESAAIAVVYALLVTSVLYRQMDLPGFMDSVVPARPTAGVIRGPLASATGRSRLDALLQVDVETYLPGDLLPKVDIATMAHSLEARSPFLDHELMEYAAAIPAEVRTARYPPWIATPSESIVPRAKPRDSSTPW